MYVYLKLSENTGFGDLLKNLREYKRAQHMFVSPHIIPKR